MYTQQQVTSYVSLTTSLMSRILGRGQTQRLVEEKKEALTGDADGNVSKTSLEAFAESLLSQVGNSGKQAALRDELEEELEEL